MRVEIALAIAASFIYFLAKGQTFLRSLGFTFLTYALIFSYCALPFAYAALTRALGWEREITVPP